MCLLRPKYIIRAQEQYCSTLVFKNTSNRSFVAKVSGNHPGILMSSFFSAARCLNTSSNLLTRFSYFCFSSLSCAFLSSTSLSFYLNWCLMELVLFSWMPFSSSTCFFLVRSACSVWFLISELSSFYLASQRTEFYRSYRRSYFYEASSSWILRLAWVISSYFVCRLAWSYLMIDSFYWIYCWRFLRLVWYWRSLS